MTADEVTEHAPLASGYEDPDSEWLHLACHAGVVQVAKAVEIVTSWRNAGDVVAVCHGCFDPLHLGHVLHFHEAREGADRLVVSVGADRFVERAADRPLLPASLRARMVAEVRIVDLVTINDATNAVQLIESLRPSRFVKGCDYGDLTHPDLRAEAQAARSVGANFVVTQTPKYSATGLVQALDQWRC